MAVACCAKKQRLSNPLLSSICCGCSESSAVFPQNGLTVPQNMSVTIPEMCYFCFDVLSSYLHDIEPPKNPDFTSDHYPLFVTWKIRQKLRGCMGTFSAMNLHQGLREYSITSATRDSRFAAIDINEFRQLTCSVSLLTVFEPGKDYLDWEIGKHGIRIEFYAENGHKKTATFLPEVASERSWGKVQTIDALLRKGGYKQHITDDYRLSIRLTRYQSQKVSITYQDYITYRNSGPATGNSPSSSGSSSNRKEHTTAGGLTGSVASTSGPATAAAATMAPSTTSSSASTGKHKRSSGSNRIYHNRNCP